MVVEKVLVGLALRKTYPLNDQQTGATARLDTGIGSVCSDHFLSSQKTVRSVGKVLKSLCAFNYDKWMRVDITHHYIQYQF